MDKEFRPQTKKISTNAAKKAKAKFLYKKCIDLHGHKCWITGRDNIRFNFHHKKIKSIFGGTEISKLCKANVPWDVIETELDKCRLIGQHIHLAFHNFLRILKDKQEDTYEFALDKFKELYIEVNNFNDNEIIKKRKEKNANKGIKKRRKSRAIKKKV